MAAAGEEEGPLVHANTSHCVGPSLQGSCPPLNTSYNTRRTARTASTPLATDNVDTDGDSLTGWAAKDNERERGVCIAERACVRSAFHGQNGVQTWDKYADTDGCGLTPEEHGREAHCYGKDRMLLRTRTKKKTIRTDCTWLGIQSGASVETDECITTEKTRDFLEHCKYSSRGKGFTVGAPSSEVCTAYRFCSSEMT